VKTPEEKEKPRLKECRRIFGEYEGWQFAWKDMADEWDQLKAELAGSGRRFKLWSAEA
jgi:hypothetical protein